VFGIDRNRVRVGCVEQARDARAESADIPRGWVRLATRTVDFGGDHDIIEVGGDGRFTTVRFASTRVTS